MRIRQVKPAFWTDVRLAELPPAVRLTYIGLWMISDDGGWFRFDVSQIANELYGYEPRRRRERAVLADIEALVTSERVILYECGHGFVPHLTEHQRLAGETHRVLTVQKEHHACLNGSPANPRESPLVPDTVRNGRGTVRNVKVRNGNFARETENAAATPEGAAAQSEFQQKVPRPA